MTTALDLVLRHPHILFLILVELPQRDLLLCQRVCKTWQATITHSHILQKALFFEPDLSSSNDQVVEVNEMLVRHFRGFFLAISRFDCFLGPFRRTLWHKEASQPIPDEKRLLAYRRKDASWRRMLLSRPAPRQLQLFEESGGMMGTHGKFKLLSLETADQPARDANVRYLRFGLIYDTIQAHLFGSWQGHVDKTATMFIVGVPDDVYNIDGDDESSAVQRATAETIARVRSRYKGQFPGFASPGSVLLRLGKCAKCCSEERQFPADYLESEGHCSSGIHGSKWEVEAPYDNPMLA